VIGRNDVCRNLRVNNRYSRYLAQTPAGEGENINKNGHANVTGTPVTKQQTGFTLIELLIVVAIIGVLVAVALPMYQRYTIRSQVAEGLSLSSGAKDAVGTFYMNHGTWPTDNSEAGLATETEIVGNYTAQVAVVDNVIQIQYGVRAHSEISGETVTLTAFDNSGSIDWTCASAGVIEDRHLPDVCR
jgi:type IV pilus assembly protein PilA